MDQAAKQLLEKILGNEDAPTLSPLAVRLVDLASDESASIQDLVRVIEQDPGISARLLMLANSPSFRVTEEEVTNLNRAVVFLGLREVRIMALGISLRHTLPLQKGDPQFYQYWRMSLHRAVLARLLAQRLGLDMAEDMFVAGLMLELGLPLMLSALEPGQTEGFVGVSAGLGAQLEWEHQRFGIDHRMVGAATLKQWGLPRLMVQTQKLIQPDDDQAPVELRVADFARRLAEALFADKMTLTDVYRLARKWFGLLDEDINQIVSDALAFVGEAAQAMDLELDHQADMLEVMEKANQALARLSQQVAPHVRTAAGLGDSRRLQEETVVNTLEAVAHEIRNPLMSVGGFARRLVRLLETGGELQRYAEVIIDEAGRLDDVLAEMTSLVKPFEPSLEALELGEIVRRICGDRSGRSPKIKKHLGNRPVEMMADRRGIEKMLGLMLEYGSHLAGRGGDGSVHLHLAGNGDKAVMTIFGAGASPEAEVPLADRSFGPEMGMAKARRIVEAHGGDIDVSAGPKGGGFVLSARLPQKTK